MVQQVQDRHNAAGKGSNILVLSVVHKKNVSNIRESPALHIIHLLDEKDANVISNNTLVLNRDNRGD